jgi:hypothetical protein
VVRPGPAPEHAQDRLAARDVAPTQRWRSFWATLSPQERAAASRTIASVYAEAGESYAPVRIAVVHGRFPAGVVALVIPNPLRANSLLVVLPEQTADYQSLALASRAALDNPDLSGAGVLAVRIDGSTSRSTTIPYLRGARRPSAMVKDLDRGALRTVEVDLPGIGRGRLLEFY